MVQQAGQVQRSEMGWRHGMRKVENGAWGLNYEALGDNEEVQLPSGE